MRRLMIFLEKGGFFLLTFFVIGLIPIIALVLILLVIESFSGYGLDLKQIFGTVITWTNSTFTLPYWFPVVEVLVMVEIIGVILFLANPLGIKDRTSAVVEFLLGGAKKPVAVELPRKGVLVLGFNQGEVEWIGPDGRITKKVKVFTPFVPNPLSGRVNILDKSEVFEADVSRSEILSYFLTLGVSLQRIRIKRRLDEEPEP